MVAGNVEPQQLKNCKDLIMKLEVKYIFPTSSSSVDFYNYQLPEGLEMRNILAHGIRMQKNPQTRVNIFWIFMDIYGVMSVHIAPLHGHFMIFRNHLFICVYLCMCSILIYYCLYIYNICIYIYIYMYIYVHIHLQSVNLLALCNK